MNRLFTFLLLTSSLALPSQGAVIYSGTQNLAIPITLDGLYLNLYTGATDVAEPLTWTAAPWINPFLGGTSISNSDLLRPVITGADQVVNLTAGTLISGSSNFVGAESVSSSHVGGAANQFALGVPGYVGFEFEPTTGGATYYGWMSITINNSGSGTIHDWAWEDSGAGILAGAMAPEPGRAVLVMLGLMGVVGRRRRR